MANTLRPCTHPGCHALVRDGNRCANHRKQKQKESDDRRPNAHRRGYGKRWQKYRRAFLAEHPLCVACQAKGRVTPATDVDHIQAVTGPDDPLFWEPSNHQALCHACHSSKTAREDGGFRGAGA